MSEITELCELINKVVEEKSQDESDSLNGDAPIEVIIKADQFDTSKIKEYTGGAFRKLEFRPTNFTQFIGQTEAKERAKTIIKKANKGLKAHFLVDGIKGHGKTSFVELVAKELDAHIIKRVGKQVNVDDLVNIVNEINASKKKHVMLFIDEIDSMDWEILKVLNPVIESFEIAGKRIKPFIFVGATINKHILIKNNPDTLDRIQTHIKFLRYDSDEIATILTQYIKELYKDENIEDDVIKTISENCKFNPRTSIALLEDYIVERDIQKVLKNCHIINNGLTTKDIEILTALNNCNRAMGANALAMKVKLSQQEYTREFEPFLVEYDYINRVPSRIITEKGKELLNELLSN